MAKITGTAAAGAITCANNAHHIRLCGIEIAPENSTMLFTLVTLGNADTSTTTMPNNIILDRCYIHAFSTTHACRRGVEFGGPYQSIIDSRVADFKEDGADTQAVWTYNSPGPLKIVNNFLEAAGENFMAGGDDPAVTDLIPSDIEIRHNHFYKPLTWIGTAWDVKNLIEFKNAKRVLVEGNTFENVWPNAQTGYAMLITPRNQNGTAPWCGTQDITVRKNIWINVGQGWSISGYDSDLAPGQSIVTTRLLIENNLMQATAIESADGRGAILSNGCQYTTIRHNTVLLPNVDSASLYMVASPKGRYLRYMNNIVQREMIGDGVGLGTVGIASAFDDYEVTGNAMIGAVATYPSGNFYPANLAAVSFTNTAGAFASNNYTLSGASPYKNAATDGTDIGCDIAALNAAIA